MSDIVTESQAGLTLLTNYFNALATYLNTGGTPPDLSTIAGLLTSDNLLSYSQDCAVLAPSFSAGFSTEVVSEFAAIEREIAMAQVNKVGLYAAAASEAQTEAEHFASNSGFVAGVFGGADTSGSKS